MSKHEVYQFEDWHLVVLIGPPGARKTVIGERIATDLHVPFFDTDDLIVKACKKEKLQDVVDDPPKGGFIKKEGSVALKLLRRLRRKKTSAIVATGGSMVYSKKSIAALKKSAFIIYLRATAETIRERVGRRPNRGIVVPKGMTQDEYLNVLVPERDPLYVRNAHWIVDTDGGRGVVIRTIKKYLCERYLVVKH